MTERLGDAVRRTFELVSLRQEALKLRTGQDWQSLSEILDRHSRARRRENLDYANDYETRIETARKILVDEAAKPPRDLTNRMFWRDRLNTAEIERRAERLVRQDHARCLAKFDRSETKELKDLVDRVDRRERLRDDVKQEHARVVDRRSGKERRQDGDGRARTIKVRRRGPTQTQD